MASSIMAGVLMTAAGHALAQDASSSASGSVPSQVGEVVVTGSRIPTTNATSPSPISVATAKQIALTNAFSMEDVLTRLAGPDYTGGISTSTNGGLGLSEIGLRNLGPNRTLVLIDGQRLVPIFSGATSVPDLNSVPVSMVDRVEVLRDGASSIYGADAIGGVINIITKKNFDGLQLDSSGGLDQHGGGASYSVGGTLGFNTDRGNLTVSVVHEVLDPVDQPQRDWSQDPHFGDPIFPGGSTYRSQLNILQDANSDTVWNNGIETSLTNPALGSLPCLTFFPDLGRVMLNAGCPAIHPSATVTSGLERTQFSFSGHYDIADHVRLIASGFFTDRQSEQRLRPEPLLGVQIATTDPSNGLPVFNGFQVPVSWPGFTDPNHTAAIAPCADPAGCIDANYTPDEFGPRDYRQSSRTYRIRVGLEGDFLDNFKWEAGFIAQRNDATYRDYNSGDYQHLAQATGQAPCLDVPGGCTFSPAFGYAIPTTPFNFFNGVGTLTPTQVQYLTFTMTDTNYSYQNYGYANLNGKLFDLPAGPLQFAAGFERRYEYLADNPDPLVQAGYAANTGEPTAGGYNVTSVYGELRIPLIKDAPFMESLTLNPSARYDHYSDFGDAETWKVAGEWKISRDVRVRASWASGFRAPSTAELFGGNVVTYVPVSGDPCDSRAAGLNGNANAGAGSLAAGSACYTQLSAQGLTPAQIATYQSPENNVTNDQRALVIGGNPNLQPEKSRQWNAGVVLTPRFLPGFSADADYYQVHIHNSIVTGGIPVNFGPDLVVDGCYVAQNTQDCSLITRNSGGVFQVSSQNTNFGITWVKGLDMEVAYDTAAAGWTLPFPGSFVLDLQAERQFDNKAQQPDGSVANSGGTYNYFSESVSPKWRGRANLDYHLGTWTFHYDAQWIGHAYDFYFPDPANAVHGDYIPNYFYHNISMAFELPSAGPVQRTNMVLGINNLLDKDPPFLGTDGNCKCNSLGGPYDFYGREFFARVSAKF